ncbi:MAG: hypothetical protein V7767_08155, partial [Leeuwenhoekiella sp.]
MAPMKFEENMKEKLNERTITPSASAWDSIENGLKTTQKRKKIGYYKQIIAAACFIGILILAGIFLIISKPETKPQLVEVPQENIKSTINEIENSSLAEEDNVEKIEVETVKKSISNPVVSQQIKEPADDII